MKKYISVLALAVRSSIFQVLGVLSALSAAELGMLYLYIAGVAGAETGSLKVSADLGEAVSRLHLRNIFIAAVILLALGLAWSVSRTKGSRPEYTLRRLNVGRKRIFVLWSVYHALCIALLFAVQILLIFLIDALLLRSLHVEAQPQRLFMAFFREDFLHSLIPLKEWSRLIRNLVMILSVGMSITYGGYVSWDLRNSRSKAGWLFSLWWTLIFLMGFGREGLGEWKSDVVYSLIAILPIFVMLFAVKGKAYEEIQ